MQGSNHRKPELDMMMAWNTIYSLHFTMVNGHRHLRGVAAAGNELKTFMREDKFMQRIIEHSTSADTYAEGKVVQDYEWDAPSYGHDDDDAECDDREDYQPVVSVSKHETRAATSIERKLFLPGGEQLEAEFNVDAYRYLVVGGRPKWRRTVRVGHDWEVSVLASCWLTRIWSSTMVSL